MHYVYRALSLLGLLCFLTACGPVYEKKYSYVPPKGDIPRMCIAQCYNAKTHCEQLCKLHHENCIAMERREARHDYQEYKRDRRHDNKPIDRDRASFDRSYTCNTTCQCKPAFNTCYSACGGTVHEHKKCIAFCGT